MTRVNRGPVFPQAAPIAAMWALVLGFVAIGLFAAGVSGCATVPEAFLEAERATYDLIAPRYLIYVEADPTIGKETKLDRANTIHSWDWSLRQHEKALLEQAAERGAAAGRRAGEKAKDAEERHAANVSGAARVLSGGSR